MITFIITCIHSPVFWIIVGVGALAIAFVGYCCCMVAGRADDLSERLFWEMTHKEQP
jgi:hypothetical protein